MKRYLWTLACLSALTAVGCGSDPSKPDPAPTPKIPAGSTIAVVSFADCMIKDQDDCAGSGDIATSIFMTQLGTSKVFHLVQLSRPVGTKEDLSNQAAADYAKSKGYAYVLNGEVTDFYKVSAMAAWGRKERGGIKVYLLDSADGKVIYEHVDMDTASALSSPQGILKSMADDVRDDIEGN